MEQASHEKAFELHRDCKSLAADQRAERANTAANNGVNSPSGARQPRITPPRIVLVTDSVRHI